MVRFFNILLNGIWDLVNIPIPIDDGLSITPLSVFVFMTVLGLIMRYVKLKGEQSE